MPIAIETAEPILGAAFLCQGAAWDNVAEPITEVTLRKRPTLTTSIGKFQDFARTARGLEISQLSRSPINHVRSPTNHRWCIARAGEPAHCALMRAEKRAQRAEPLSVICTQRQDNHPASGWRSKVLAAGHDRSKAITRRKDDSNDDRQTKTLPGHRNAVPRVSLPPAQDAWGRSGSAAAHEWRGAGGMHFAQLHVPVSPGTAGASQPGAGEPISRTRQQIKCRMNREDADRKEIGRTSVPETTRPQLAQRQSSDDRPLSVVTTE